MTTVIHLPIPTSDLLTSNQARVHWATRARRVKNIRIAAHDWAKRTYKLAGIPVEPLPPVTCRVEVTWPDKRRRDAHNLQPTVKAAIDGFVDAGLLVDDSDEHLKGLTFTAAEKRLKTVGIACYLKFTFTPVEAS
jgi:hypothetical protein